MNVVFECYGKLSIASFIASSIVPLVVFHCPSALNRVRSSIGKACLDAAVNEFNKR